MKERSGGEWNEEQFRTLRITQNFTLTPTTDTSVKESVLVSYKRKMERKTRKRKEGREGPVLFLRREGREERIPCSFEDEREKVENFCVISLPQLRQLQKL